MRTKVVHCKKDNFDIYIGRPSIWGNPFIIGKHGNRKEVLKRYKKYVMDNPLLASMIMDLEGLILGCWCKPKNCHGDVLVELIEGIKSGKYEIIKNGIIEK